MNKERLLNVAKALRESPNPEEFTMSGVHTCGTPQCALGHYAARTDLQSTFAIDRKHWGFHLAGKDPERWLTYDCLAVCEHFGITASQADELFRDADEDDEGSRVPAGCGDAETAIEAAEYIERFVAQH